MVRFRVDFQSNKCLVNRGNPLPSLQNSKVRFRWEKNSNLFQFYFNFFEFSDSQPNVPVEPPLPRMKKKDMTLTELKKYDGSGPEGRVCVAVLGKIYDVTRGKRFYGPGNLSLFLILIFLHTCLCSRAFFRRNLGKISVTLSHLSNFLLDFEFRGRFSEFLKVSGAKFKIKWECKCDKVTEISL